MMALGGPERAIDGLKRPWGIWVMGDGTAAVSVGLSGVYVHVSLDATRSDLDEARRLLVVLGHTHTGRGFADRNGIITFPAL